MAIRITGMYSGLDTESIISELVSAQSVKKSSMVKAQTKLSWKQDAWKALNTKIFSFYSNTLSNMRFQASYKKKTTKVSNSNAISVVTSADAVDGVRTVRVDKLAKGAYLTGADLTGKGDVGYTGGASLESLLKHSKLNTGDDTTGLSNSSTLNGSFSVVGADGSSYKINVNSKTTINDVVDQLKKAGLDANYDQDSQRIFVSAKNTGKDYNFALIGNDEGGLNALAVLGLLSDNDLKSSEYTKWAAYKNADGTLTADGQKVYDKMLADKVAAYKKEWDSLTASNKKLKEANEKIASAMDDTDVVGSKFNSDKGKTLSSIYNDLYSDGGLYDKLQDAKKAYEVGKNNGTLTDGDKDYLKQQMEAAQKAYDDAKAEAIDYLDAMREGPLVEKKVKVAKLDEDGNEVKDDDGNTVYEEKTVYQTAKDADGNVIYEQKVDEGGSPVYEQKKDEDGNLVFEADGTTPVYDTDKPVYDKDKPVYTTDPVMVHDGKGLTSQWNKYQADGTLPDGMTADDLKAQINSYNKWIDAFTNTEANRNTMTKNDARISEIAGDNGYITVSEGDDGKTTAESSQKLKDDVMTEFSNKVAAAQSVTAEDNKYAKLAGGTKIEGQDAEILLNGAKFTSSTNTFTVNGLTLTAMEETHGAEVTLTTSTDTDGIYDMIKNFFSEYNKLINEMDSLYNAEAAKGYEPLTSEEKDALSDTEVEEWEKKIKDSLLRRDSTLRSVSGSMTSILLQGASVNGKQMYLSDFGIATLGYFKSKDNERNAYHIDGDSDDMDTKSAEDKLKAMIASDPDTVMNFFSQLSTNLYNNLTDKMSSIKDTRSAFTVYNDKVMKKEYDAYTDKIKKEEEKLNKLMDSWYSKFSKMETALSKLESKNNSLASLFGN
ncbi:MAG: flagellar filament capping protein FliD [Lachnospiraceae bacterium]|nr:flagellar filament capping protein FliD [Lachnospiraceae bacterium]